MDRVIDELNNTDMEEIKGNEQVEKVTVRTAKKFLCRATVMAFSPDGSFLTLVSESGSLWLWDLRETGYEKVRLLRGHTEGVVAVAFSLNCLLASASKDRTVSLWDPKIDTETQDWGNPQNPVKTVAFSADGRQLGSISSLGFVLEAAVIADHRFVPNSGGGQMYSRAPNSGNSISLWDPKTGDETLTTSRAFGGFAVNRIIFSPDGSLLLPAFTSLRLWNSINDDNRHLPEHATQIRKLSFSGDGETIIWTDYGGIWAQCRSMEGYRSFFIKLLPRGGGSMFALSLDGKFLAVLSVCKDSTNIELWDPRTGRMIRDVGYLFGPDSMTDTMAICPNGLQLALALRNGHILLWSTRTCEQIQRLSGYDDKAVEMVFSPDGSLLASISDSNTVQLWDLKTGQRVNAMVNDFNDIREISFTADSNALITNRGRVCAGGRDDPDQAFKPDNSRTLVLRHDWIEYGGKRVLWLPVEYRSNVSAFHGDTFAIGRHSGQVSFLGIRFP